MADKRTDAALLEKIGRLQAAQAELVEKLAALSREIADLLAGGSGIAGQVKQFEETYGALWSEGYAKGGRGGYVWNWKKDRPQIKRLLARLGLAELEARALNYLRNPDPFYARTRHSFNVFVASINSHAGANPVAQTAAPADCHHVPPCPSDAAHTRRKLEEVRA